MVLEPLDVDRSQGADGPANHLVERWMDDLGLIQWADAACLGTCHGRDELQIAVRLGHGTFMARSHEIHDGLHKNRGIRSNNRRAEDFSILTNNQLDKAIIIIASLVSIREACRDRG